MIREVLAGLRPADALNVLFLMLLTAIAVLFRQVVDHAGRLVLLYAALIFFQAMLILFRTRGPVLHWLYHLVFPTLSILLIFDSLGLLVHAINPRDIDPLLIRADLWLFGGHPTVMLERIASPLLTDLLQVAYTSYYFLPIALGAVLLIKRDDASFDRAIFLIMLCFYLSYIGYLLFPALGPRFTLRHLQHTELAGIIITAPVQDLLNRIEGIKRDAFPSGHTGIALTVLALAWRHERRLFGVFLPFVLALILATVYLRYHYVVDVIAGVALAALTLITGDACYGAWQKGFNPDRRGREEDL